MSTHWVLETGTDPVATVQAFLYGLFAQGELDAMLVPIRTGDPARSEPHVVQDAAALADADPLLPMMTANAARLAVETMRRHPGWRFAAVLHACELRALNELLTHEEAAAHPPLLIGLDCLGTFPEDAFPFKSSPDRWIDESLQFARQGGVAIYRYRPACQMCVEPLPQNTDLTIELLGLPARRVIMVEVRNAQHVEQFGIEAITDRRADPGLIEQRERVRQQVRARRTHAKERITQTLSTELAMDVDTLLEHLEGCAPCQACLNACPIAATRGTSILTREDVIEWLAACAGCGMCEAACPEHLPLAAIFARIHDELNEATLQPAP